MKKTQISTVDLILLGLIRNEPLSPYDLSKMVGIYELVKISTPAIYKNIRRLYKQGYLQFSIEKKSNMPEKKIYSLTEQGEKHFFELLDLCAKSSINYFFDFNVSLLFLGSVDKNIGRTLIDTVDLNIKEKQKLLDEQVKMFNSLPFPIPNLGKQHSEINTILNNWMNKLKEEYNK